MIQVLVMIYLFVAAYFGVGLFVEIEADPSPEVDWTPTTRVLVALVCMGVGLLSPVVLILGGLYFAWCWVWRQSWALWDPEPEDSP